MIHTLLVANRGEIAVRVMRTAARMGVRTVAIFTDLDAEAPHVRAADEAVRVDSYLDVDEVVAVAVAARVDAVHPGYGFLSERAAFAAALEEAGVRLVGPAASVMERMGRKDAAREIAVAAGVPVVPSYEAPSSAGGGGGGGAVPDAASLDYPVLVKAAAGGGGKGMRVVRSAGELDEAVAAARREARGAFGDDTMLLETYVERGRHVEVQVIGDAHGTVLHLAERDCSTQRRHQKVLEEAPAPTLDDATRDRITRAAVDLAAHVGYEGAGTVEFLLDPDANGGTGAFYFLEMNTRLQVEHPVTELVTGLDLVELQLRVAAGEPLPLAQEDVRCEGHAIEARVYAEDSFAGFLPQAGTATLVRWPGSRGAGHPDVRVDHALEQGQVVSTAYDPMLGKVIAHGSDREAARQVLVGALDETAILGLTTNAGFLRALVAGDDFRDATIDTAWLDRHEVPAPDDDLPRLLVAWTAAMLVSAGPSTGPSTDPSTGAAHGGAHGGAHPFQADGFRLGARAAPIRVELDRDVFVDRAPDGRSGTVDGVPARQLSAAPLSGRGHELELVVDGLPVHAVVHVRPGSYEVALRGQRHAFTPPDRLAGSVDVADGTVSAPMPGTVLDVRVATGETVEEGQTLGVLEAMKMELSLTAPFAGTVAEVAVAAGDQVALGARLLVVEPAAREDRADHRAGDAPAAGPAQSAP